MGTSIFKKSELEDLKKLLEIAEGQNNCINLNLIYMTLTLNEHNYDKVMNYFSERGITMIQDDIEPEATFRHPRRQNKRREAVFLKK